MVCGVLDILLFMSWISFAIIVVYYRRVVRRNVGGLMTTAGVVMATFSGTQARQLDVCDLFSGFSMVGWVFCFIALYSLYKFRKVGVVLAYTALNNVQGVEAMEFEGHVTSHAFLPIGMTMIAGGLFILFSENVSISSVASKYVQVKGGSVPDVMMRIQTIEMGLEEQSIDMDTLKVVAEIRWKFFDIYSTLIPV